jgi:hypothetical protein
MVMELRMEKKLLGELIQALLIPMEMAYKTGQKWKYERIQKNLILIVME